MTSPFVQPDFTSQLGSAYKTNIDNAVSIHSRLAGSFAPQAQATPDNSVLINPGPVYVEGVLTELAAQNRILNFWPTSNDRIDRIFLNTKDGSAGQIMGTEDPSPVPPDFQDVYQLPCAQVYLRPGVQEITNADITDERIMLPVGWEMENTAITLDVDFNGGNLYLRKVGRIVTLTATSGLSLNQSLSNPTSSVNLIPGRFEPFATVRQVTYADSSGIEMVEIGANGQIKGLILNWSGALRQENTFHSFTIAWGTTS